jgi:hypothetical protein
VQEEYGLFRVSKKITLGAEVLLGFDDERNSSYTIV